MRHILLFLIMLSALLAETEHPTTSLQKKQKVLVGGGAYVQSQPYEGADAIILPTPVIFFDNKLFYVRWTRVGMYFLGSSDDEFSWGLSLTAQPRPNGYKEEESSTLKGMDTKEVSWEAGLSFATEYKQVYFELIAMHDLLDTFNGYTVRAELGTTIKTGNWSLYPSLFAIYRSDYFNNYYYGVKESEETLFRPAYNATGDMEYAIQAYIKYDFTKEWSTLINLRADQLSNEAYNSPIVDTHQMYSGMVSLLYTFEY